MKRIAVIEDSAVNRLVARVLLEDRFELHEYDSGPEALEGMHRHRPDLVLLDISLPDMDGTVVLARIRADRDLRDLPVIAVTAHAMDGDRERYLAAGFDEYVSKPIADVALWAAVDGCLRARA
jgi:CheY-like chemotaxis protein